MYSIKKKYQGKGSIVHIRTTGGNSIKIDLDRANQHELKILEKYNPEYVERIIEKKEIKG
jgi:hypothetical protein